MYEKLFEELNKLYESERLDAAINAIIKRYKTNHIGYNASMYVLPDGTLLDLGDSGYGHSEISQWLEEQGLEKDFKEGTDSKLLRGLGWIRVNNRYKFITLSDKAPNTEQYSKLLEIFDFMKNDFQVTTNDGQYKVYKDRTPDEVVYLIKRYYSCGTLFENKKIVEQRN